MAKEEINAFLGGDTCYTGKLQFDGAVRIDGKFTGEITSGGALIVGQNAVIEGEIRVGELLLAGNFTGTAYVERRTVIHKSGNMKGILNTPLIQVEEGAVLDAKVVMTTSTDMEDKPL